MDIIKNTIKRLIPKRIVDFLHYQPEHRFQKISYSIYGEDLLIDSFVHSDDSIGTYIDIGCNHPLRFSNTYYFYKRGWFGICIDPLPEFKSLFEEFRPNDKFLNFGVGKERTLEYFKFADSAYNTFSRSKANSIGSADLISTENIDVYPLGQILLQTYPDGKIFDFMSIDVEGFELEVLESNNWQLFKFRIILIEIHKSTIEEALSSPLTKYLQGLGYIPIGKNINNVLFKLPE